MAPSTDLVGPSLGFRDGQRLPDRHSLGSDVVGRRSAESKALQRIAERLTRSYDLPPEVINAEIARALSGFTTSKVRDFVPVLIEREVLDHLRQIKRSRHGSHRQPDT